MNCKHELQRADGVHYCCSMDHRHNGRHECHGIMWSNDLRAEMRIPQFPGDTIGALVAVKDVVRP